MKNLKKLATIDERRNYLVTEQDHHILNFFSKDLLTIEIKKTLTLMNKVAY